MTTVELLDHRWRTTLAVIVSGRTAAGWADHAAAVLGDGADAVEQAASRFRTDSALSAVNAGAGTWVAAPALLVELVGVALAAAEVTDGLVTPCVGAHVDAAGYRAWRDSVGVAELGCDPGPVPAWHRVEVAPDRIRIPRGCRLDLGATAKAWLADEIAERLAEETGLAVVANMGGDLRVAGDSPAVVGVDQGVPGLPVHDLELVEAGLATSGQGRRRWLAPDGPRHHVIDPRTGTSARSRWWTASVVAGTATAANVAATAALLLDSAAPQWLSERGVPGLLAQWDGAGTATQHPVGDWPSHGRAA